MIVVTGTKRSGTSAWMQVLAAAGLPVLGKAFPGRWELSIQQANPRGFFETGLRRGVWWATNPDPKTGKYLHPTASREQVVKIFIPGLVRTDHAFLHRVIATMRPWREYSTSLRRLYAMEDLWLDQEAARPGSGLTSEKVTLLRERRGRIPPTVEWWFENYDLIRTVATRRFPFHMLTYDRLLRDPELEVTRVIGWLGRGDATAAISAVDGSLRTRSDAQEGSHGLEPDLIGVFDEFYAHIDAGRALTPTLIDALNQTHRRIEERYNPADRRSDDEAE